MDCKVGITGSIASGKSLVTAALRELKYPAFDADFEVRKLYENQDIQKKVLQLFPNLSTINKEYIAKIIYNDTQKRLELNNIFHPLIETKLLEYLTQHQGLVFADIPLLYETNLERYFDYVICAYAPDYVRLKRFEERTKKIDANIILSLIDNAQMSQEKKASKSDFIVHTHEPNLMQQLENIIGKIKECTK